MSVFARLAGVALGAAAARAAYVTLVRRPPGGGSNWSRTNHRGEPVTLLAGPACVAGVATGVAVTPCVPPRVRMAVGLAALGAGGLGAYDDLTPSGAAKGFKGHLGALARGEVTSGAVKLCGIGVTGLAAGALVARRPADVLVCGAAVAGSANLVNLFDLRPGRAIKVGLLAALPLLCVPGPAGAAAAAPLGAAVALLPDDLGERAMLGDAGANALGAALGVAVSARLPTRGRLAAVGVLAGLTAASEVVSFTRVIEAVAPLRWADGLGRRSTSGRPGAVPAE
ncbi:MAG: hypothetical protein ACRDN9_20390 [Streptosporangiaceae bacterium]